MKKLTVAVVCAVALFDVVPARAQEPTFEALGQAPVVAGDRVRARERALDEAMKQAVEQAVATVLDPDQLVARNSDLRLRIYPKARSYVTNYRVLDEGDPTQAGVFQMHISAQVSTGRLQRDLATPAMVGTPLPRLSAKLRAVVCVAVQGADGIPPGAGSKDGERALSALLTARNVELVAPPAVCSDAAAAEAARVGAAQGAVVGSVDVKPAGPIRGTDRVAVHARGRVHVIEPDGRVSAEGDAERDAYDASLERAAAAAARDAVSDAARPVQPALATKWAAAAPTGGVTVRLNGIFRYSDYLAVTRAIAALPGVAGVEPRRFQRGQAELVVRTASAPGQLARGLERVPPQGVRVTVRPTNDGGLTVDVAGGDGEVRERG
jgi:hypothetical protein